MIEPSSRPEIRVGPGLKPSRGWVFGGLVFATLESIVIWSRGQAAPLFWIGLIWTGLAIGLAGIARQRFDKALWLNVAALIAALAFCEGALWIGEQRNPYVLPPGTVIGGTFAEPHHFVVMPSAGLGYRPRPSTSATAIKTIDGNLVYAVRYGVGADGLRIAPPANPDPVACVLFFGDSLVWGEGVADESTAAYQLGLLSRGRLLTRNFAFTGYGAHQMLWQIQSGAVKRLAGCNPAKPVVAIFETLPNDLGRVAGLRGWDDYGPRYRLVGRNRLTYAGGFDEGQSILHDRVFIPRRIALPLSRSLIYARILGRDRRPDAFDARRFATVVRAAMDGLRRIYPKLEFQVVLWPDLSEAYAAPGSQTGTVFDALHLQGIPTKMISAWLPDYDRSPGIWAIAGDGHPNASAHLVIARALLSGDPILRRATALPRN